MVFLPAYFLRDSLLGPDASARLLAYALAPERQWAPSEVRSQGSGQTDTAYRQSSICLDANEPLRALLQPALEAHLPEILAQTGLAPFPIEKFELELAMHGDGGYFLKHADTFAGVDRTRDKGDRLLSIVYYLSRIPRAFTGGELVLHPFTGEHPGIALSPEHDRLVAFASFAPHEVLRVRCPGDRLEDRRFSINCWLRRPRLDQ